MYKTASLTIFIMIASGVYASDSLFYLEAQGVGGYSSAMNKPVLYSMSDKEPMQKPGIGFDYLRKFSGDYGDFGSFAFQSRISYDRSSDYYIEPQVYNLYFKAKTGFVDLWAGHNRPAMGMNSYLDSHSLLLPALTMNGFGFDRDWGIGISRDFSSGDISTSLTTGSGMPVYFGGSYLASARASFGVLSQDNFNIGVSASVGDIAQTEGNRVTSEKLKSLILGGLDAAVMLDNFEFRLDAFAGKKNGLPAFAVMLRVGMNLLDESRLKLEIQPVYIYENSRSNYIPSAGAAYIINGDLTARTMYMYDFKKNDHMCILQLYLYLKLE